MSRFFAFAALVAMPTLATAQIQTTCQRVWNTVQCQTYGNAPQQMTQQPVYQQNPIINQMLSPGAVNGFAIGLEQARERRIQQQLELQQQQIDNCRYAAAHGFACD
jgi:hypothetical protein